MADDQQDKNTSQQSGMHVLAKPIGPVCDIKCDYCFYLEKRALFGSGEQYRMPDEVLSSYIRQYVESQPTSVVEFVWHGGEPTLLGVDFAVSVISTLVYCLAVSRRPRHRAILTRSCPLMQPLSGCRDRRRASNSL